MMKRFLISALIVLFGAGAVLFYYWQQATQLPSWYTEPAQDSTAVPADPSELPQTTAHPKSAHITEATQQAQSPVTTAHPSGQLDSAQQVPVSVQTKIENSLQQQTRSQEDVQVKLNSQEVNVLFSSALQRKAENSKLGKAVQRVNTTIQNGKIESGAVMNLAAVSIDQLPAGEQAFLDKLIHTFPELGQRKVYIGIEGNPIAENGQVRLDDSTRIKLGNLSFTTAELAQRLGVSEEQIRQRIQLEVQLGRLKANDIELEGDNVVIRGSGH